MSDFLRGELERKLPQIYGKRYPGLWGITGEIIPMTPAADLVAMEKIYAEYTSEAGQAKIYAEKSQDIPLVSTGSTEDNYKIFTAALGARWTFIELEQARIMPMKDLVMRRTMAVQRGLDEKCHRMAIFGDTVHKGLLNQTTVPQISPSLDLDAPGTTSADLIDFFAMIFGTMEDSTNDVEMPDTLILPPKVHRLLRSKVVANTDKTVLVHLLENYGTASGGTLRRIVSKRELTSENLETYGVKAGGTNKDMIVLMSSNPDSIHMEFTGFSQLPLTANDTSTGYTQISYRCQTEVMAHYPKSMLYVNIDKL